MGPVGAEVSFVIKYGTGVWEYTNRLLTYADDPLHRRKINGYLFDDRGAFGKPKTGDTPKDQPEGQFKFTPKK